MAYNIILLSLIFLFLLSKNKLNCENISALPSIYGQDWFSEKRQRISNSYWHILTWILPSQTVIPLPPSMPYERSFEQEAKSISNHSAICAGSIEKSAPVSSRKSIRWYPYLFLKRIGISTSGMLPRVVSFSRIGNSINTDSSFWGDVADNHFRISDAVSNFIPQRLGGFCRRYDTAVDSGYKFTSEFFLKLWIAFRIHVYHLYYKLYHTLLKKSSFWDFWI